MLISIHADAFRNPRVKGSSVYVLSERGATDEAAKWLADQENAADLIGGVSLGEKDKTLAAVLLDLSQSATIEASTRVAGNVLSEIRKIAPIHKPAVQHARFVVLKSPDIPSLLVETAFISNPREEKRLKNNRYQNKLAKAILKGIKQYFKTSPPPDTRLAQQTQRNNPVSLVGNL
jgi:N-acetylmuramoyl-L-alanine amidase